MKVYQENKGNVNGAVIIQSVEITNNSLLYAKARDGLPELSMSLGLDVMRMMLEQDVTQPVSQSGGKSFRRTWGDLDSTPAQNPGRSPGDTVQHEPYGIVQFRLPGHYPQGVQLQKRRDGNPTSRRRFHRS